MEGAPNKSKNMAVEKDESGSTQLPDDIDN